LPSLSHSFNLVLRLNIISPAHAPNPGRIRRRRCAYHPDAWHELYVTLGGALAALTGLRFVATSLHVDKVAQTPHWARRAFTNNFSLIIALIESLLVLAPQPAEWLGAELIALNLFALTILMLPLIRSWLTTVKGLPPLRLFFGTAPGSSALRAGQGSSSMPAAACFC
jgi:hypothetical protein